MASASRAAMPGASLAAELESIGRRVSFTPGACVMVEGESGKGIYILRSGRARVSTTSHEGDVIPLRELQSGSFIGLSSALTCDQCCYSVETAEASEFTFIPAEAAQELLRSRTDLCLQVIHLLAQEMSGLCNERAILQARARPVRIST